MMTRTPGRAYRETGKTRLAFAMIYFVWGSALTAIRAGIREVPPFLFAAMYSMVASLVLCRWMIARGERFTELGVNGCRHSCSLSYSFWSAWS
jgi:hypothetical protein